MIGYRPKRETIAQSMKESISFETMEELRKFVQERWARVCRYMDSDVPFSEDEVVIGDAICDDSRNGWKNLRKVSVMRIGKIPLDNPLQIGWCGEE